MRARRWIEPALVVALLVAGLAIRVKLQSGGWRYAGSDSYGYMKLAVELREHGRYALGPPPEPLSWVRPPLYPIFLALVQRDPDVIAGSWKGLFVAQIALDLMTALLAWAVARRLGGKAAGLIALVLAVANPFTPLFTVAMLTETLAEFLTMATLAVVLFGRARPLRWWPLAGALVALSALLRPDGLMLAIAFVPIALLTRAPRRTRLAWSAVALAGFVVVFAPWPIRNQARFGHLHPLGGRIDRFTRPVENYQGYWAWLRSWAPNWDAMTVPTTCFYEPSCPGGLLTLRGRGAYKKLDDEAEVRALIGRRWKEGITPEVSRGFQALADRRRHANPLYVELWLPLSRTWYMWATSYHELLQTRLPWPRVTTRVMPWLKRLSTWQWLAILIAGVVLTLRRRTRIDAAALFATIVVRTAVLGYTFYSMPRYTIEVMPLGWVLIGAGAVEVVAIVGERVRAYAARARAAG